DEKQRELSSSVTIGGDSTALNTYQKGQSNSRSGRRQSNGSGSGSGSQAPSQSRGGGRGTSNQDRRSMFFYDHYKAQKHIIDHTKQHRGTPFSANTNVGNAQGLGDSSDNVPNLTRDHYNQLLALIGKANLSKTSTKSSMRSSIFYGLSIHRDPKEWIIDSGAIHHITPHLSFFSQYYPLSKPELKTMPNGSTTELHILRQ
ncbi:hypothetical protein V2J09_000470, partial [Rumex salicifolius]